MQHYSMKTLEKTGYPKKLNVLRDCIYCGHAILDGEEYTLINRRILHRDCAREVRRI